MQAIHRICALLLLVSSAASQSADGLAGLDFGPRRVEPFLDDPSRPTSSWNQTPLVTLSVLDPTPLMLEDAQSTGGPTRIGVTRATPQTISIHSSGQWTTSVSGGRAWRCKISSPGAQSMRIFFERFELPDNASLLIGDPGEMRTRRYTRSSANSSGSLWSATFPGDELWLEYEGPLAMRSPFEARTIVHNYAGPSGGMSALGGSSCVTYPCHEDVLCANSPPATAASDAVGHMGFVANGNSALCSGALLNDGDLVYPHQFLTAYHCISTQASVDSLEVTWDYISSSCNGSTPIFWLLPDSTGSYIAASDNSIDMSLIAINDANFGNMYFAGWTTAIPTPNVTDLAGIHHPHGCRKRISTGRTDDTPANNCNSSLPLSNYYYGAWNWGHTEGGSSGSPLFLQSTWQVVGQLFGACGASGDCGQSGTAWNWVYGRFDPGSQVRWVRPNSPGPLQTGSSNFPYDTIGEGVNFVQSGGQVSISAGSTGENLTIDKACTLVATGGTVTIGS